MLGGSRGFGGGDGHANGREGVGREKDHREKGQL